MKQTDGNSRSLIKYCILGYWMLMSVVQVHATGRDLSDTAKFFTLQTITLNKFRHSLTEYKTAEITLRNKHFVRAYVNKMSCFTGEPVIVTYKLYSVFYSTSKITRQPSLNNFMVHDLQDHIALKEEIENINGRIFKVHTLRKIQIVPLQAGKLVIEPIELNSTIRFEKNSLPVKTAHRKLRNVFDDYLNGEKAPAEYRTMKITAQRLVILVKPLPDAYRPANFEGAVGHFTINGFVASYPVISNAITMLRIEISGSGNFSFIDAPSVKWPININGFDVHAAGGNDDAIAVGKKIFEYKFTALKEGVCTISPIAFSFFDPAVQSYKTIQTEALSFNVEAEKENAAAAQNKNKRIPSIPKSADKIEAKYYALTTAAVFILVLGVILYKRRLTGSRKAEINKAMLSNESAGVPDLSPQEIPDPLETAKRLLADAQFNSFYTELNKVLHGALVEYLQLLPGKLDMHAIAIALQNKGWSEEDISHLDTVLMECRQTLYIPGYQSKTDPEIQLKIAESVLTGLLK